MPVAPDGYDCFRELIQELRRQHFDEVAGKIDLLLERGRVNIQVLHLQHSKVNLVFWKTASSW